jgi:hypothetical protein
MAPSSGYVDKITDSLSLKSGELIKMQRREAEYRTKLKKKEKLIPIIMSLLKQNPGKNFDEKQLRYELNLTTDIDCEVLNDALKQIIIDYCWGDYCWEGYLKHKNFYCYSDLAQRIMKELKQNTGKRFTERELYEKLGIKSIIEDDYFPKALKYVTCKEGFRTSGRHYYYVEP